MTPRNLDVLKWIGVVAMLVDHYWLYVVASPTWFSEAIGALALPLFAIALGEGVRDQSQESRVRTLERLLLCAALAQGALLMVREELRPLNIVFAIGAGVYVDTAFRYPGFRWHTPIALFLAFLLGFATEFGHFGIILVAACCWWSRTRSDYALALGVATLLPLSAFNDGHWALAAVIVTAVVSLLPRDVPRARNAFYAVYVLQWPLLAAVRYLVA